MTRRAFAAAPTRTSPFGWNETTLGRSRAPFSSARTWTFPARTAATTVFVVPRSMPTTLIWGDPQRPPSEVELRSTRSSGAKTYHLWLRHGNIGGYSRSCFGRPGQHCGAHDHEPHDDRRMAR